MANYRRRMIWPSLLSDPHFQKLRRAARLLFLAHILTADDEGRGELTAEDWKSLAFPQDPDVDEDTIEKTLLPALWKKKKRKDRALVESYNVAGREYWYLPKWFDYQRVDKPTPSKIPDPMLATTGRAPAKGNGKLPSAGQWELLFSMAEERGTTAAKVAGDLGLDVGTILARDVTKIRQALEKIPVINGKDELGIEIGRLFRPLSFAIQVGDIDEVARLLGEIPAGRWPEIRTKIKSLCSNFKGSTTAEVFESIREFSE